jgi:hypothetical protein
MLKFIINPSFYRSDLSFNIRSFSTSNQLKYFYSGPLTINIKSPAAGIHFIGYNTTDQDLLFLCTHNLTYKLDTAIYTNQTSLVIFSPISNSFFALKTLNCCLIIDFNQVI